MNGRVPDPLQPAMRLRELEWEAFHCPIPLAWMSEAELRQERRFAAALIVHASYEVRKAQAADDPNAYRLARGWLEDAQALWAEFREDG